MQKLINITTAALLLVANTTVAALAQDALTLTAGKALVTDNCSACHAVDVSDTSTYNEAPAFRTLSQNYPVENLAEALAEGIMSGHPDMPEFTFEVDDVNRIIAWLENIQE